MKTTIIGIVIALIIGSGIGYGIGKGSVDTSVQDKKLQDSVTMMKEQSGNIQQMGTMMQSGGVLLQEMGMKYKDDTAVMKGKDMEAVGVKYMAADKKATEGDSMMKNVMQ
jgi:hypothetical protein